MRIIIFIIIKYKYSNKTTMNIFLEKYKCKYDLIHIGYQLAI